MSDKLRKLFHANKPHQELSGVVNVLVSLKGEPDKLSLSEFKDIGLEVKSVSGDKLIGEISVKLLPNLEQHAQVIQVERSVKLNPMYDCEE